MVKVVASDGSRTASAASASFAVPGHEPLIVVSGLPDAGSIEQYDTVLLQAHVFDPEDKGAVPASVAWTSDLGGEIASGPLLRTRDLAPGVHSITVAVADTDGNAAVETFQLTIDPRTTPTRYLESPDSTALAVLTGESPSGDPVNANVDAAGQVNEAAAAAENGPAAVLDGDDGGSALPILFGLVAIVGVAGVATFLARRRRAHPLTDSSPGCQLASPGCQRGIAGLSARIAGLSARHEFALDVFDDLAMFVLRAEQDHLGVGVGAHAVSGRPVEHVAGDALLRGGVGVRHREVTADHVAPMGDWQAS